MPPIYYYFRYVYKWFLLIYKVSYVVGITGYVIMMATFLGLHFFFGVKPHIWLDAGLLLMFYALYYGVMARDIAEICTEKMVSQIGVSICTPPEVLPKANRKYKQTADWK